MLADPGDPISLRSNAVELVRAWKPATLRDVKKVTARAVKLLGADKGTQKLVRALLTGYLLHLTHGDKTYRDFSDPEVALPRAEVLHPFSYDPIDLENEVVALLKP